MKRLIWLALFGIVWSYASFAQAAITLGPRLTFDGGEDTLVGISRTKWIDADSTLGFSDGDTLFGFVRISSVAASGKLVASPLEQIAFVFSARITSTGAGTDANPFTLAPIPSGAYALTTLLAGTGVLPSVLPDTMERAIFIALGNSSTDTADSPLNFTGTAEQQLKKFQASDGWMYEALAGVAPTLGGTNAHGSVDFLELTGNTTSGREAGGFSILDHVWGSSVQFLPILARHTDHTLLSPHTSSHDFTLDFPETSYATASSGPWTFTDSSQFRINATPEPTSLAMWAGLIGVCCVLGRRRSRQASNGTDGG